MSQIESGPARPPIVSNTTMALIVYVLYFIAYFVGFTAIIGVIIAHVQNGSGDPLLDSHYRFQVRTFWVGLIYLVIGSILALVLVGYLIRNIKGVLALNENRPIANPTSWMFG